MEATGTVQTRALGLSSPVRPWRPAPFGHGRSPYDFAKAGERALGQRRKELSGVLFDDPLMATILHGSATILAAAGTATFDSIWLKVIAWGVLVGAGAQTMVSVSRVLGSDI